MTLSNEERGFLERRIDSSIKEIKTTIVIARNEDNRKEWQIQNDGDFALGWALGTIFNDFAFYYSNIRQSKPNQEEMDEAIEIISKRVRELKEAIFKCG